MFVISYDIVGQLKILDMKKIETAMLQTLRGGNNPSGACIQSMLVYGT
jgi:hypothetical protein